MQINKRRIRCGIFVIVMFSAHHVLPQEEKEPVKSSHSGSLPKTIICDIGRVLASPLHLSKREGLQLAAFTATTAGLYAFLDDPIDEEYAKEGHHSALWPAKEMAEIGKLYDNIKPVNFAVGVSAGMLISGLVLKDKKLLETTRLMVEAVVLTEAITFIGKSAVGRARPAADRGPHDLHFFQTNLGKEFQSMPSGHASSIFAITSVVTKQYDYWWLKIPAYTFATSVMFQRMNDRRHWASDVLVGGGIGYWVGSKLVNKKTPRATDSSFQPYLFGNAAGVVVSF